MAEVVDAIIADLVVKNVEQYEANFNRATAAHGRFMSSVDKMKAQTFDLGAEGQKYKAATSGMAQANEQADQRVTRSRKKRADDVVAQDEREVRSAKAAAKAKADAEVAEAQRSARLREAVERGVNRSRVTPGTGANLGRTVPREGAQMAPRSGPAIDTGAAQSAAKAAAETEVNHILADQAMLQARLATAKGKERDAIREQLAELRLIRQLERAGIADDEIALRLEQRRAVVAAQRSRETRGALLSGAARFGEGAGLSRFGGSGAAIAGLATAAGVAVGAQIVQSAVDYGKALANLSQQLGISTDNLQAYLKMARDAGVTQEQLTSAFGQFASNLGRAQQNEQEQVKVFKALGINIKEFASAGDALPTVIDRISQIKDPAQRAAVETRLFGEEGRRLDALLSGGAKRVSELTQSLLDTGQALSAREIQELDETARKLASVKAQLQVDFARIVAGNADSIRDLAQGFGELASQVLNAIQRLRDFGAEQILNGGPLGNLPLQDSRDTVRNQLLGSSHGRGVLARNNLQQLDQVLFGDAGPLGTGSLDSQRGAMIRYLRSRGNSPALAQVERLLREQHEILVAGRQSPTQATPQVQDGRINTGLLSNLGTPKPPKGKSAEQQEREAEERTKRFNDQLAAAQADFLRAQEQMTGDIDQRAKIEQQLLERAYNDRLKDIESDRKRNVLAGADAKLEAARAKQLRLAEKAAFTEQSAAIEQDRRLDTERALTQRTQSLLDVQAALISSQIAIAKTAAERRRLELELLENQKQQERNRLEGVIRTSRPGDPAAADAQAQIDSLDRRYAAQARATRQGTQGPLAQYLSDLPRTAEQVDEALQNAAVHGLQSLNDGLTDAVKNFLHLNGIAGDFLGQLIQIGIQRRILIPLADKLFPSGGENGASGGILGGLGRIFGGGGASSSPQGIVADPKADAEMAKILMNAGNLGVGFGGIAGLAGIIGGIFGRASGGTVVGGQSYLVGENGPEIVKMGASGRVYPNGALPTLQGAGGGLTVIAPQHFDLSGVVMTEPLLRQMEQRNRDYANQVAAQAGRAAVAAGPGRLKQLDTLGS